MSRALIVLRRDEDRARARLWVAKAPPGTRIEFKAREALHRSEFAHVGDAH